MYHYTQEQLESMKKVEAAAIAHTHTETALEDEAATCTTDGYTTYQKDLWNCGSSLLPLNNNNLSL